MIEDERIKATKNHFAAHGFYIWYVLLLTSLLYRIFYLHEPVKQHWDIYFIFFIGSAYVFLAFIMHGACSHNLSKRFSRIFLGAFTGIIVANYFNGNLKSVGDLGYSAGIIIIVFSIMFIISFYLNHRWQKRNKLNKAEE